MEMKRNKYLYKLFVLNTPLNFYLLDFKMKIIFRLALMGKTVSFFPIPGVEFMTHYDILYIGFEISADTHILPYFIICSLF